MRSPYNIRWVMHDEATAHYVGMVDQTHLGHAFIRREFGEEALPKVAWQIDPFGHSATQASLLGAQARNIQSGMGGMEAGGRWGSGVVVSVFLGAMQFS